MSDSDCKEIQCPCVSKRQEGVSLDADSAYCVVRKALRGECVCQRWVHVEYYGDVVITPATWEQLFKKMLRGIDCEFFGYERLDDQSDYKRRYPPCWYFMIYLKSPSSRREVMRRFKSRDFRKVLPSLGDSTLFGPDGSDDDDESDNNLYPGYNCCSDQFFLSADRFLDEDTEVSFASNEEFLTGILRQEFDAFYSWCRNNSFEDYLP